MPHLELEPCGLCCGWVAGYGRHEVEDSCPLRACLRVLRLAMAPRIDAKAFHEELRRPARPRPQTP